MNMKLKLVFVISILAVSVLAADNSNAMEWDVDQIKDPKSSSRSGKGWGKKYGMHNKGFSRGELKRSMKDFMDKVPKEELEKAQKIITYLHTSHRVAKSHMRSNNTEEALQIMQKRMRLKLPTFFDQAPPMLKYFKLSTEAEMAKIYAKSGNSQKSIEILENVLQKSSQHKDFPKLLLINFRHELMRAYKQAGMQDKADDLLKESMKEAESDLEFE